MSGNERQNAACVVCPLWPRYERASFACCVRPPPCLECRPVAHTGGSTVSDLTIERKKLLSTQACALRCGGELDAHTLEHLENELARTLADGVKHIVVDLREVSYCSSRGIGVLVRARKEAVDAGGGLVLMGPPPTVATALEVLGFDDVFDIVGSEREAVEVLGL